AILAGIEDDSKKMDLIFNYVRKKVKWNNILGYSTDFGVKEAYNEGVGNVADINLMLIAMLRYAKLNADPMLISTRSNDIPLYPSTSAFNYVVAAVQMGNDVVV